MPKNPILEELYAVRSQIQAEHGDQLSAFLHGEFERLKAGGHPVAQTRQWTIRCPEAARSGSSEVVSGSSPRGDSQPPSDNAYFPMDSRIALATCLASTAEPSGVKWTLAGS